MQSSQQHCILCGKYLQGMIDHQFLCPKCFLQQTTSTTASQQSTNTLTKNDTTCPQCTFKNPSTAIQCMVCQFVFQQKLDILPRQIQPIQSMVTCKQCKFQNHIANQYCLRCDEELFEFVKKDCGVCGSKVRGDNFDQHYVACLQSRVMIEEEKDMGDRVEQFEKEEKEMKKREELMKRQVQLDKARLIERQKLQKANPMALGIFGNLMGLGIFPNPIINNKHPTTTTTTTCYYCYTKIPRTHLTQHTQTCEKKLQWQTTITHSFSRLTPLQVKTIMHMHQKSAKDHKNVRNELEKRVGRLGYSGEDLDNLGFYIENYAPIIIQIHISKHMQFFVKDTHYRSQFETNKSSGSLSRASRTQWQDRMFDQHYSKASDFQRVKYGVINFTNDPKGVKCAKSYGPSYFLLKSHVRDRCTFTDKDSSGADSSIATLKFGFKIISKMNDNELKAAFQASKALEMPSDVVVTYKELQIHGPVEFAKDVERVYASKTEINGDKRLLDLVYEFSEKFKVQHDFI